METRPTLMQRTPRAALRKMAKVQRRNDVRNACENARARASGRQPAACPPPGAMRGLVHISAAAPRALGRSHPHA